VNFYQTIRRHVPEDYVGEYCEQAVRRANYFFWFAGLIVTSIKYICKKVKEVGDKITETASLDVLQHTRSRQKG
jgi:hypothetical protein